MTTITTTHVYAKTKSTIQVLPSTSNGSFPIEHFPFPSDTYSDTSSPLPALSHSAPASPGPSSSTPTPSRAVLPTYVALVANRKSLLATLSAAKAEATTALAEASIAQAELDDEVTRVQGLVEDIAKFAGWEFVKGVIMNAQAAVAEDAAGAAEGSADGQDETKGGKIYDPGSDSSSASSSSADDQPLAPNPLKRRRDSEPAAQGPQPQEPQAQTHRDNTSRALVRYSSVRRTDGEEPERKRKRAEAVWAQEEEAGSGFVRQVDGEAEGPGGAEGVGEDEESDEDDSSYVTSGSDIGSRFSSSSGSSFPSDNDDDDDDGDNVKNDSVDEADANAVHPTGRPIARARASRTDAIGGFENGGTNALAVGSADEGERRVQKVRDMLAATAAREHGHDEDNGDGDDESDEAPASQHQFQTTAGPSSSLVQAQAQPQFSRPLMRDSERVRPSGSVAPRSSQPQPVAGPSRPLARERAIVIRSSQSQPQPEAGPSGPRPLARERERVRETRSGHLEAFLPEEEPGYAARVAREEAIVEEWRNYGVQAYPYAADLWEIKTEAGWVPDDRWT